MLVLHVNVDACFPHQFQFLCRHTVFHCHLEICKTLLEYSFVKIDTLFALRKKVKAAFHAIKPKRHMVLATILLKTNHHLMGNVINIMRVAFSVPGHFYLGPFQTWLT